MEEPDSSPNRAKTLTGQLSEIVNSNKRNIEWNKKRMEEIYANLTKAIEELTKRFDDATSKIMEKLDRHAQQMREMTAEYKELDKLTNKRIDTTGDNLGKELKEFK